MYSSEPPQRGGSYEYPQSMFLSRNEKQNNKVYPCKPQLYYIKVGFKGGGGGSKLYRYVFVMLSRKLTGSGLWYHTQAWHRHEFLKASFFCNATKEVMFF